MDKLKRAMLRAEKEGTLDLSLPTPDEHEEPLDAAPAPSPELPPAPPQPRPVGRLPPVSPEAAEALAGLRTEVLTRLCPSGGGSVLVTSAHPGEGKTFAATHLAFQVATQDGRAAVLVDANLAAPSAARAFGLRPTSGLAEVLVGEATLAEALTNSGHDGLLLVAAGNTSGNQKGLAAGARMGEALQELRERCPGSLIVVDGPSLLHGRDATALAGMVDAVLLVVAAGKTPEPDLVKAAQALKGIPAGIVYNRRPR